MMLSNFSKCTLIMPWIFQHCELLRICCGSSCEVLAVTGEGIYIIYKLFQIPTSCPHRSPEADGAISFVKEKAW